MRDVSRLSLHSILQNPAIVNPPAPPNFYEQLAVPSQTDRSATASGRRHLG
jgi:hypothetical protein